MITQGPIFGGQAIGLLAGRAREVSGVAFAGCPECAVATGVGEHGSIVVVVVIKVHFILQKVEPHAQARLHRRKLIWHRRKLG
jgi:hypothetical protein